MLATDISKRIVENPHKAGSPEWLAVRRQGIGASEVAAVLGMGKYQSPLDVWLEKRGQAGDRTDSPQAEIGRFAEPMIARIYEAKNSLWLTEVPSVRHPVLPFLFASADRMAYREPVEDGGYITPDLWQYPVEIKNRGGMPQGWGEDGTDQVPDEIAIQVHVQLECYDLPYGDVAVLLGGNDFRTYRLHRDATISGPIVEAVEAWWTRFVVGGEQPPLEGPGVAEYLAKKWKQKNRDILKFEASHPVCDTLRDLGAVKALLKQHEQEKQNIEAALKEMIGEAGGIETPVGKVTWNKNKDSEKVDWEAVARELAFNVAVLRDVNTGADEVLAQVTPAHTTVKEGPRVLRVTLYDGEG